MARLGKLTLIAVTFMVVTNLIPSSQPHLVVAQGLCPTAIGVGSLNGVMTIDSAVQVTTAGCPFGQQIGYWVYIPASGWHAEGWYEFAVSYDQSAWLDLTRNEQHPTEFPPGTYLFTACGTTCPDGIAVNLSVPAGSINGGFNPWAPGSNMQFNRGLCRSNGACGDGNSETIYGFDIGFTANLNVINACSTNCLYHNLNAYFTNPNPGDSQRGFTQLVVNQLTTGFQYLFATFSLNIVYCRTDATISITNPGVACASAFYAYDGLQHVFWATMMPPAQCVDTRYYCLKVYDDGRYLADERMVNGGALNKPYLQNESYTSSGCAVWGAQLDWTDYHMLSPCALNSGLYMEYRTEYTLYQQGVGGIWNYMYPNAANTGQRYISNPVATFDIYCGPFTSQYPSTVSMLFGSIPNGHPCTGGLPQ